MHCELPGSEVNQMNTTVKKLVLGGFLALTAAACGGGVHYVRRAPYPPPPPRAYRVTPAPRAARVVWIDGYHDWRGRRYVWVPGRWVRPPRPNAVWIPGRWDHRGGRQVWVSAHWRVR